MQNSGEVLKNKSMLEEEQRTPLEQALRNNRAENPNDIAVPMGHVCSFIGEKLDAYLTSFSPKNFLEELENYLSQYGLKSYAPKTLSDSLSLSVINSQLIYFLRKYFQGIPEEELWPIVKEACGGYFDPN